VLCLVGAGRIEEARAAWQRLVEDDPAFASAPDNPLCISYQDPALRERRRVFLSVAAGLLPPEAADAVR